jgi:hypothetical protein
VSFIFFLFEILFFVWFGGFCDANGRRPFDLDFGVLLDIFYDEFWDENTYY